MASNVHNNGGARPSGRAQMAVRRDLGDLRDMGAPLVSAPSLLWRLTNALGARRRGVLGDTAAVLAGRVFGVVSLRSKLNAAVYRPDFARLAPEQLAKVREMLADNFDVREIARYFGGHVTDYGLVSTRLVTDTGVGFIVDAFQNLTELENMKYHGFGTGTTAESAAQTALVTELTTQYSVDNTRPTGTTTEGASANIYRTVATLSPDSGGTIAVTEHAPFSQAATGGGVMMDRSVFSAVNLVAGSDSLQATYELTLTSGG